MLDDPAAGGRYPGQRRLRARSSGPGPGAGHERDPWHAAMVHARILLVATIVVGQLWGLAVALDAWLRGQGGQVWLLLGFESLSFAVALALWLTAPRRSR